MKYIVTLAAISDPIAISDPVPFWCFLYGQMEYSPICGSGESFQKPPSCREGLVMQSCEGWD